jgi:hypothetical protein
MLIIGNHDLKYFHIFGYMFASFQHFCGGAAKKYLRAAQGVFFVVDLRNRGKSQANGVS